MGVRISLLPQKKKENKMNNDIIDYYIIPLIIALLMLHIDVKPSKSFDYIFFIIMSFTPVANVVFIIVLSVFVGYDIYKYIRNIFGM